MKSCFSPLLASTILVTSWASISSCFAQTDVALVDIKALFKAHPVFNQQLDSIRVAAESFQAESIETQQALARKAEVVRQYKPNSTEFRDAESELAREAAALEVAQRNKMVSLMKAEAKLHFDTYQQINELISQYCEQRSINLVLRHSPVDMSNSNPDSVMQKVNSSIVFFRPSRDITDEIKALLPQQASNARSGEQQMTR